MELDTSSVAGFMTSRIYFEFPDRSIYIEIWLLLLILAAVIGGAFWGILYNWRGNLFIPILAHVIWCVGVLAVYPIG